LLSLSTLQILLPNYLLLFFLVCFALRVWKVKQKTGKLPISLGHPDTAFGYVTKTLKWLCFFLVLDVAVFSFFNGAYDFMGEIQFSAIAPPWIDPLLHGLGILCLVLGFGFTATAQSQMRESWRIGISENEKTKMVERGLYRYSRNPIYLGIYLALLGIWFLIPSIFLTFVALMIHFTLQMIVRLEEAYLERLHGTNFVNFCKRVRRWI